MSSGRLGDSGPPVTVGRYAFDADLANQVHAASTGTVEVDPSGFEPEAFRLQTGCSSN